MTPDVFNPMPAHDTPDPSYIQGPIQSEVPDYVAKGRHHPHDHPDAALLKIADAELDGTYTAAVGGRARRGHTAAVAPSSALRLREKRK